ncbi:MAG: hypothetical protein OXH70_19435 [Acidobacteria bacterium]|nr:hypothetical protein [Acidobacteriota bacterium]
MLATEASNQDGGTADGFEVVAAPVAMWREVPRQLLPSTTVESGSLSLASWSTPGGSTWMVPWTWGRSC